MIIDWNFVNVVKLLLLLVLRVSEVWFRMALSKTLKAVVLIIVIVIAAFVVYAVLTFPRTVVSFPVSFTAGFDTKTEQFDVPILHGQAQVEISVQSGTAIWHAQITSGNETIWSHTTSQTGQTTYASGWQPISTGTYNFMFGTIGIGSLEATVKVTTKGGFW